MNTKILAFSTGLLLAATGAHAASSGVASSLLIGPQCVKSTVGAVEYAWPVGNSSMTVIFQSSHDNGRSLTVLQAADEGVTYYPNFTTCNEGDKPYPTPFVAY